jgi:hypothetical protein
MTDRSALMTRLPLLLSLALATTQDAPPVHDTCGACDDKGTFACGRHDQVAVELESNARFCSFVAGCPECRGTLEVDCKKCTLGDRRVADARDAWERWMEGNQEHWDRFKHDFPIGRSDHFLMFWSGDKITVKRERLSDHEAMHLYLDRLEDLYERFKAATGAVDDDFSTVFHLMVWKRFADNRLASEHYTNQPNPNVTGTKRMGAVGIYTVHIDPAHVDPDESATADLYRAIVHNVAHLLLANVWDARWPGQLQGGWIDAGVAHYFEDQLHQRCTNFCYREQDTVATFKGGRWRAPVKTLANKRGRPSFVETAVKKTTELSLEEHALVWSYCEFLISTNPKGFGEVCKAIKQGNSYRDALKEHFDLTPLTFETAWKKLVKTYKVR